MDSVYTYGTMLGFYTSDFFMTSLTPDFILHHTISIYLIVQDWLNPTDFRKAMVNVEIPSIVLITTPFLPKPFQEPAKILYACLFVKFRIIDMYPFLTTELTVFNLFLWGFHILHLYWACLILRKRTKFLKDKKLMHVTHTICAFTLTASFLVEYPYETPIERIAHVFLAITSFNVHWFYERIHDFWWATDIIAIHLVCMTKHRNYYHSMPFVYHLVSYAFHTGIVAIRIYHIKEYTGPFSMLPMFLDGILTMHHFDTNGKVAVITTGICMILTESIRPLYELTFVSLHALIILCMHLYLVGASPYDPIVGVAPL